MESFKVLLNNKIIWEEKEPGGTEFYVKIEGKVYELTMNDFPEEPLYTLRHNDAEVHFDDAPENWVFPEFK